MITVSSPCKPKLTLTIPIFEMEHQFSFFSVLVAFLLILIISMALRAWKKSKTNGPKPTLPPGPWRLPIIGNMHQLVGSAPHFRLRELAEQYGPLLLLQLGEVPHVVVSSAKMAEEVMKTHDANFASRPFILAASVLFYKAKDVAFAPYGESWRTMRKICILELLSTKRVTQFRSIREEEVISLVKSISSSAGSEINLSTMLLALTNSITSRAAFHKSRDQDEFTPLIRKISEVLAGFSIADFFPSVKLLPFVSGMMPKIMALHRQVDSILEEIVMEHRKARETKKDSSKDEQDDDLVDVLLNLQEKGNLEFPLTIENVKAAILDIFLAGVGTLATTLNWTMTELMRNPRVMKLAQTEVRRVYHEIQCVDETRLRELNYLQLVIKETLRLHPPAPLLAPREARESVEINGYKIPSKAKILVNAWAIARDQMYWDEAEKFYPERFIDSSMDYKGTNFEYLPFGAGRRICPGMQYGMVTVELCLANLLYHFDWKLPNGMKPEDVNLDEVFGMTLSRRDNLCLIPVPQWIFNSSDQHHYLWDV